MPDKRPSVIRQMKACLTAHFSAWFHSPRTLLMGLFILCIAFMLTRSYQNTLLFNAITAHLGESVFFHLNMGFNMTMTSIILLIMVSEIPKRISYQNYILIRTSRVRWLASLIIFCVAVVLLTLLLLTAFSTLLTLPYTAPGGGWSDLERLAENKDYRYEMQLVPEYIRAISPWRACVYAASILFFFWLTMLLVILLFAIWGRPNAGLILYAFVIFIPVTLRFEMFPGLKTPMHFATLSAVARQFPERELASVPLVLAVYFALDCILALAMLLHVRHTDLCFNGKE